MTKSEIVICGHSHVPFYKNLGNTHFINPGSIGRMFDGDPRGSCAILQLKKTGISVEHFRVPYNIDDTTLGIIKASLPEIYIEMYRLGKKTN